MNRSKLLFVAQAAVVAAVLYTLFGQFLVEYAGTVFGDAQGSPSMANILPEAALVAVPALLVLFVLEMARRKSGEALPQRLAFVGLSLAGVVAGIGLAIVGWTVTGKMALKREIASLEAEGLAAKFADRAKPADDENAVVVLQKAEEALKKSLGAGYAEGESFKNLQKALDRFAADGTTGAELEAAKPMLATNAEAMALAVQATGKKASYWEINFSPPIIQQTIPEHLQHNILVNLLTLQAIERAEAGDIAGAASSIRAGLALGDVIGESPLLLSQMFRGGVNTTVLSIARQIFDTPAELAVADASWSPYLDPHSALEDSRRAYQADILAIPREIAGGSPASVSLNMADTPAGKFFSPILLFAVRKTLQTQRPTLAACKSAEAGAALPLPAPHLLTRAGRSAAYLSVAKAAIEHAKSAKDPATGNGNDPFTGAPLRLVVGSAGTLIFSVGPDGKDDGGVAYDRKTDTGDIGWLVRPNSP